MLFRKSLGHSILNEITKAKVERVKAMLADDGMSVLFISDMCGFTSANELDRVFRRVTGMSPRAWRESGRRVTSYTTRKRPKIWYNIGVPW